MKKLILPVLFIMLGTLAPATVLASSSLEISTSADFSAQALNFSGGQMVFVRVASMSVGSKKSQLNLRDNQYNLINTFKLEREGAYYSAALPAPYNAGYYSLEAQIESEGASTTSVKTIKVGSPSGANINVHVNSSTGGQSEEVLGEKSDTGAVNKIVNQTSPNPIQNQDQNGSSQIGNGDAAYASSQKSIFDTIGAIFREVADFFWPFN